MDMDVPGARRRCGPAPGHNGPRSGSSTPTRSSACRRELDIAVLKVRRRGAGRDVRPSARRAAGAQGSTGVPAPWTASRRVGAAQAARRGGPLAVPSLKRVACPRSRTSAPTRWRTSFVFAFASSSALEPGLRGGDVRNDRAESGPPEIPITAKRTSPSSWACPRRGSRARRPRCAPSAGTCSTIMPPKQLRPPRRWGNRSSSCGPRGRVAPGPHPPHVISRVRATYAAKNVAATSSAHQRRTDYSHGFGEMFSMAAARVPLVGNYTSPGHLPPVAVVALQLRPDGPWRSRGPAEVQTLGACAHLLAERGDAQELMVDRLGRQDGQ